jgi:sterol desaturase/sphingolipid hydroxylase (fatty acid hydroxylase superfamily)
MSVAALRLSAYPLLIATIPTLAVLALDRGLDPGLVILIAQLAAGVLIAALERIIPFEREWLRARDHDLRTDLLHFFVSTLAVGGLVQAVATDPLRALASSLSHGVGPLWPHALPWPVQLVLALLISELGLYTLHRLQHTLPWLIRLHEVHHGVSRLYFLNVARNHPLDTVLTMALGIFPLLVLGASERVLVAYAAFTATHAFFQHANVDARLGLVNRWISLPEQHRFHHSSVLAEARGNYGSILLVWDHVFGTALTPKTASRPARIAPVNERFVPPGWLAQLAHPFRPTRTDLESHRDAL